MGRPLSQKCTTPLVYIKTVTERKNIVIHCDPDEVFHKKAKKLEDALGSKLSLPIGTWSNWPKLQNLKQVKTQVTQRSSSIF